MNPTDLRDQVLQYITRECGGAIADPSAVPEAMLEAARVEYGRHRPVYEVLPFTLGDHDDEVELPDVEIVAVVSVHHVRTGRMGENLLPPEGSGWPSLAFIDARFRDIFGPSLAFIEMPGKVHIVREVPEARGYFPHEDLEGAIVFARLPSWEEIPHSALPLLTKYAFSDWLHQAVVQRKGVLRIPTGDGYFEYDGGKYILMLADKLRSEFYSEVNVPTAAMAQG